MATPTNTITGDEPLRIDFLFLDLETCTRCRGTDRRLEAAIDSTREVLAASGRRVEVRKIHVESAEQAQDLRFASSPTIRVNDRDIALERRESSCGSEPCTDGCGDSIACRVWVHGGEEHTEPPVAMITDAILREVHGGVAAGPEADSAAYELPGNLARFFAGKAAAQAEASASAGPAESSSCCPPAEQRTCCEPKDKAGCCGAADGEPCGCR